MLDSQFTACYSYNSDGTIKSLRVGDKLTTHYEYDSDKNLTRQWTKMQGDVSREKRERFQIPAMDNEHQTLLADYHYSYDGNGNRIRKDSLTGSTTYAYDSLNRLAKVQYPKGLEEFTYDKADNRIRRLTEKEEELYKYDVCNRLVEKKTLSRNENLLEEIQKKGEGKKTVFQYDNQGNLLREQRSNGGNPQESIYSYDGFNRQKKIVNFENKTQINRYDGEGLRHEMEENGKLVKFLYADREAVAEEKEDGKYIRYIRGYDLVASDSECARTYYHYASDEQGSITHILGEDENGEYNLKNYYEYGAFGNFREKYEEVENRFGYNGEIFDPIGGQYYLRARYYNPVIGRFTQEDIYYGDGLNLYAYCRNLPVGYGDPSGHICEDKARKLEDKERNRTLTKEEYKELHRYRRENKVEGSSDIRGYRHLSDPSVLGIYEADPRLVVDMPYNGKGKSNSNSQGWLRDNSYYWNEMLKRHPDAFSKKNKNIILGNNPYTTRPVNDATFRKYFPQYDVKGLRGKPMIHHHIGGGGQAYGMPAPLHPGYGGVHNIEKYYGITGTDSIYADIMQEFLE